MEGGIPGDPIAMPLERRLRLLVQARVLEPRVGEALGDEAVQPRRRGRVDPLALVQALEIDDVDEPALAQPATKASSQDVDPSKLTGDPLVFAQILANADRIKRVEDNIAKARRGKLKAVK